MTKKKAEVQTVFTAVDRMTAVLGRIQQRLDGTFGHLGRRLRGDMDAMRKVSTSMFRLGQIGVGAAKGVFDWTMSITQNLDKVSKMSRRAGIASSMFQEVGYAAELSGLSFDEYANSMKFFTLNMGKLKAGSGELFSFLKNVSPNLLKSLEAAESQGQAFEIVMEALSRLKDPAKSAAVATAAFGESGAKMALLVENGVEGLRKMRKEAVDFGMIVADEGLTNAEKFNDAFSAISGFWTGAKNVIGSAIAEAALPQMLELLQWLKDNSATTKEFFKDVGRGIVDAVRALVDGAKWIYENREAIIDWAKVLGTVYLSTMVIPALTTALGLMKGLVMFGAQAAGWVGKIAGLGGAAAAARGGAAAAAGGAAAAAGNTVAKTAAAGGAAAGRAARASALGPIGWGAITGMLAADLLGVPDRAPEEVTAIRKREAASSIQTGGSGKTIAEIRAERRAAGMAGMREALQAVNTIQNLPAAVQAQQQAAKVVIDFLNAPAGMSVRQIDAPKGTDVSVVQRRGTRTLGTGEGL